MILILSMFLSLTTQAADLPPGYLKAAIKTVESINADIDQTLMSLVATRDAKPISEGFIYLIRRYPFLDFYWLENRLRFLQTDVYLVAAPSAAAPGGTCAMSLLAHQNGLLPFFLWVEVNGRVEMLNQLKKFGIESEAQNLNNLLQTGLLSLIPPARH